MSDKRRARNGFIVQAGILAFAGIVSRIIGLLYRGPLHSVIGDLGLGYYQTAHAYYTIILMISSYSIPSAISKVIAQKLGLREYRNAHRVFKGALVYVAAVGLVASGALVVLGFILKPEAAQVLRAFAPTIFLYGILGVFRGYFQGHGSMVQTSVSQILEQLANALVSIGAACVLIQSAMGTMEVPVDEAGQVLRATSGAVGSALGAGAGVLVALLFMVGMYAFNKKTIQKRIRSDRHVGTDSYQSILRMIVLVVTPFILSTAIYNLSGTVNNVVYTELFPGVKKLENTVEIFSDWGVYSGQALTIAGIPAAFAAALASAILPSLAQLAAAQNMDGVRAKIGLAVKVSMIILIPCAVGLFALARPVTGLLFHNVQEAEDLATKLLMALSLSVVFYALASLNSSVLQGLGKVNQPIINAGIALVVQTVVAVVLLLATKLDLYSIAVAETLYAGLMCVLNQRAVCKAAGYRQEIKNTFVVPSIAAMCMGGVAWAGYESLLMLTESPRISVVISIPVSACVYFCLLLLFRGIRQEELEALPKGYLLVRLAKKCRLMK